jgi:hypothetical protein
LRASAWALAILLSGCAAPAAPPAPAQAVPDDGLEVVAFRVEANETRIDRSGPFQLGSCQQGCTILPWLVGWEPWQAQRLDRGLFWRVNATFAWADGAGLDVRMAAYLMSSDRCGGGASPCLAREPFALVEGRPPIQLAAESFESWAEGVALVVVPVGWDGSPETLAGPDGRWVGVIQAFHRAPGAEDVVLA